MHISLSHSLQKMVNTRDNSNYQSTQSGAIIGSNDDLLTEILLRLPVVSILRFKSVSKHWQLLLSDTHFTQRYDNVSKSPGLFVSNTYVPFDVENPSPPPFPSLDFCFDGLGIKILQSCNGLLLCRTDQGDIGVHKYYVVNPTTNQVALIPSIPGGQEIRGSICFMGLAYHQTDCVHYKLVCIRSLKSYGDLYQILIYSSDTRKWKISVESFSANIDTSRRGVYWNGALHWAPSYRSHLYFKIDVEQVQTFPLPVGMVFFDTWTLYFGESRGHLHLIVDDRQRHNSLRLNVYEMLSDHSGWFVKYQVELDELPGAFPEMIYEYGYSFSVVDVVRGEEEEDTFIVLVIPGKMITFNVHDKSFKQIHSITSRHDAFFYGEYWEFHRYTETLASF